MQLGSFDTVQTIIENRKELIGFQLMLDGTKGQQWLGVTFQGRYQDDETCDLVRPVLIKHIKQKVLDLDNQLRALGVLVPSEE